MIESLTASNAVAVLGGPRTSFLDHLVPLCHAMHIPLVCTDWWVETCAHTFYPETEIILIDQENVQQILKDYQTFVTVEPSRLHPKAFQFGELVYQGEGKTIAGFHGNPEKFRDQFWIERYAHEDTVLVYGNHSIDYLKEKGVWPRLQQTVTIGNLRREFYLKHQTFFNQVSKPHLFSDSTRKTLLFAPTWHYPDPPNYFSLLFDGIPDSFQIMVKLHPFMYRLYPQWVNELKERYAENSQVNILDEIPLIYPLIEQADIYLGDYSSVVYDFLSVNRPIFFIGKNASPWGITIKEPGTVWEILQQEDTLRQQREQAYQYVFSERHWNFTGE